MTIADTLTWLAHHSLARNPVPGLNREANQKPHFTFLAGLLELDYADYDVEFAGVRIEGHITEYRERTRRPRETKYAEEQKARRCRVAFKTLLGYFTKENRNVFVVNHEAFQRALAQTLAALQKAKPVTRDLDQAIRDAVRCADAQLADERFRPIVGRMKTVSSPHLEEARRHLQRCMHEVADELSEMWDDERYVRVWDSELIVEVTRRG